MSRAKYTSTANSVPSWVTAVNDAPASSAKNTRDAIARWPDDDTGKNSVSPCNTDRTITCNHDIAGTSVTTTTVPWVGCYRRWRGTGRAAATASRTAADQTAFVGEVDVDELAGRDRHHVLGLRNRARSAADGTPRRPASACSTWKEKLRPSPTWPNPLACTPVEMSSIANSRLPKSRSAARVMTRTITPVRADRGSRPQRDESVIAASVCLHLLFDRRTIRTTESYPLPPHSKRAAQLVCSCARCAGNCSGSSGCSSNPADAPPPTIVPAQAAVSPPVTGRAGRCGAAAGRQCAGRRCSTRRPVRWWCSPPVARRSVAVDHHVGRPGAAADGAAARAGDGDWQATATVWRTCRLAAATSGSTFAAGTATRLDVDGQQATDFTAIARRADGKLVLGSADGAVYTLSSDTAVGAPAEDLRSRGCPCHTR